MDRPMIQRSSLPQSWSQPYQHSAPPNPGHPRPLTAPAYPPHDPQNTYTAPALYPNAVSQQLPRGYSQPHFPSAPIPVGARPRAKSSISDNNLFLEAPPPVPRFPSPVQFPPGPSFPPIPVPPPKPHAFQSQFPGHSYPVTRTTQDEVPIRPAPMSARRSSSSPAIGRIQSSGLPPPVPPFPPNYHPSHPQYAPQHVSPVPPPPLPPSIPIPSLNQPYRSDSSPLYASPFETIPPPLSLPPPSFSSPSRISTSSPPSSENEVKHSPVDEEEEQLAFVIALSKKESKEHSVKISKEEEDLAKAIEESIRDTPYFGMPAPYTDAGPSKIPSTASSLSFPVPLSASESPVSSCMSLTSDTPRLSASRPTSKVSSPSMYPAQPTIDDDEALAHWLAEEEEKAAVAGPSNPRPETPVPPFTKPEVTTPAPAPAPPPTSRRRQDAHRPQLSVVGSEPPPPLYHHVIPTAQASVPNRTSPITPNNNPSLGRSSSASAVISSSSRLSPVPGNDEKLNGGRSQSLDTGFNTSSSSSSILSSSISTKQGSLSTVEESFDSLSLQPPASPSASVTSSPHTANSFIDQQLLNGVSLGFNAPQISTIKTTLKGGVPNVISLPTGRFVPFHIQAPDWRHLLKMMARLSGSRIEASIEALAATKQELKLRTVVQFVRVNTTSQDWRTVIYLTIDNPPPSNAPHKFTNGDVNTLPFSYTASPLPALFRDGPDAPMSKYYTIPATPNTPYPTLPISFPNMAMYLASVVEDSRRMAHDNSSGMKRLAKTLDTLYPAEVELGMEDDEPDRPAGGVVNMFRNVFGRGRRDQRRNDDNYADLVTPFVPEWS